MWYDTYRSPKGVEQKAIVKFQTIKKIAILVIMQRMVVGRQYEKQSPRQDIRLACTKMVAMDAKRYIQIQNMSWKKKRHEA